MSERILWRTPTNLSHTFYVDGTPTDPDPDTATVTVTRADGTALQATTAATEAGTGVVTYTLPPQTNLDHLDVTWTATYSGYTVTETDRVEIVGGFYATINELQALPGLSAMTDDQVVRARTEFESIAERYTGRAWVPRYHRETLAGSGRPGLLLGKWPVRTILAASSTDTAGAVTSFTTTNWRVDDIGMLTTDGDALTASVYGERNLTVAYEHGEDEPPPELRRAARIWIARELLADRSQVGRDVLSETDGSGFSIRYSTPDWKAGRPTGIMAVDEILNGLGVAEPSIA